MFAAPSARVARFAFDGTRRARSGAMTQARGGPIQRAFRVCRVSEMEVMRAINCAADR
jgi:hypothetical protein